MISSKVIIVGASAGGVTIIHDLLSNLSPEFSLPIVVVQHLPDSNHVNVASVYSSGPREVVEVEDKMPIEAGHIYFAPGGYHLLIEKDHTFCLTQDEPVNFSRPSIDLCFQSAAEILKARVVGVLLTGANRDGALGLTMIKAAGGVTIVQDPDGAEFPEMPKAALQLQTPDFIVNAKELPGLLLNQQVEPTR